ncbi:ribonuclease HII [archaeon]|nr:ribonuclease HII [archaeon]
MRRAEKAWETRLSPKGPVIGSMMIAGVLDTERSSIAYSEMGCKDSKLVPPEKREKLAENIRKRAKQVNFVEISAKEIDFLRSTISLNEVEAKKIAELVGLFDPEPEKLIIDCPDSIPANFLKRLHKYLGPNINAVIEHKADYNYPIVSAASIIAKTERDASVRKLEQQYGLLGTGYPGDPRTKKFLRDCFAERGKFPPCVRKSWETAKAFYDKKNQKTLEGYLNIETQE